MEKNCKCVQVQLRMTQGGKQGKCVALAGYVLCKCSLRSKKRADGVGVCSYLPIVIVHAQLIKHTHLFVVSTLKRHNVAALIGAQRAVTRERISVA